MTSGGILQGAHNFVFNKPQFHGNFSTLTTKQGIVVLFRMVLLSLMYEIW